MTTTTLGDARRLLAAHWRPLVGLTLLVYAPLYAAYKGTIASGALPGEAADTLFGLIGGLLAPLTNGAMIHLLHHGQSGIRLPLVDGVKAAAHCFGRLLTSYIIISTIFLFWAALPFLPVLVLFGVFNVPQSNLLFAAPLILPALYVTTRYAFVDATTVLEGLDSQAARFRSIDLAKPARWRLTGYAALLMALPTALDFGADAAAGYLETTLGVPALPTAFALSVLASLLYIGPLVYFYAEYRARLAALTIKPRPDPAGPREGTGKVIAFRKPAPEGQS